jgi:hypothetical protein
LRHLLLETISSLVGPVMKCCENSSFISSIEVLACHGTKPEVRIKDGNVTRRKVDLATRLRYLAFLWTEPQRWSM